MICPADSSCIDQCQGYTCQCITGYEFDEDGKCIQICDENQCQQEDICPENSMCINHCEDFECVCIEGYEINSESECVPICDENQCTAGGVTIGGVFYEMPNGNVCPQNSICNDLCEAYECICEENYTMVAGACVETCDMSEGGCCDADQCQTNAFTCTENSSCNNLCQSYECICNEGFSSDSNGGCIEECDEDQCENAIIAMLTCPVFSDCVNLCEGFDCACYDGYEMENGECKQVCDEEQCATTPCPLNSQCHELCDQYECECDGGYTMNENDECCEDLNQCIDGVPMLGISAINICPANGFCTNTCESYTCQCNDGYHMDEGECVESVVTTTAEPSTISGSGDTTTVENPTTASSSTNAPSSVYEDPHFHITGISTTQPDICFDYDGVPGTDITLLAEDSGTKVIGSLFKPHVNISEVYFDSVEIRTPQNIGLTVSARGWNIHHVFNPRHLVDPVFVESTSNVVYKDLVISGIKRQNHGFSLIGRINGTFTFE